MKTEQEIREKIEILKQHIEGAKKNIQNARKLKYKQDKRAAIKWWSDEIHRWEERIGLLKWVLGED